MEQRGDEFFSVRAGFVEARREPERIVVVDAGRDADAVHADIARAVEPGRSLTSGGSPPTSDTRFGRCGRRG